MQNLNLNLIMALAAIAYPILDNKNYNFIQEFRKVNDPFLYTVVEPHFSFVFPVDGISKEEFIDEIAKQAAGTSSFNFTIRCAVVNKDAFLDISHTLFVPDEGFSDIVKLHDKLYEGKLIRERRLDIDYIPHMGAGTSKDIQQCKVMADKLNACDLEIKGSIAELTVVRFENNTIENLHSILL